MSAASRVLGWSLKIGGISFAAGFFGPMVLAPGANQGPMLGIFITGPLGFLAGGLFGLWREWQRRSGSDTSVIAARIASVPADYRVLFRGVAAFMGIFLAVYGVTGLRNADGRGAAAVIVLSLAAFYFAATGKAPTWLRR